MASLFELVAFCHDMLEPARFSDYCPNGLQVDAGVTEVRRMASGVTASQALIDAAAKWDADLLLVHHGYFWKGEPSPLTGLKGARVRSLIRNGMSLLVYHLPLDAHAEVGNNRQLAERLQVSDANPVAEGDGLLWQGVFAEPISPSQLTARIAESLSREPLHVPAGVETIERIGWCSGAAQSYIEQAAALGLDAFVSGEISEQTVHLSRELGIHYYAAGHHATERYGVQALGQLVAERFGIQHCYIDIPNPV